MNGEKGQDSTYITDMNSFTHIHTRCCILRKGLHVCLPLYRILVGYTERFAVPRLHRSNVWELCTGAVCCVYVLPWMKGERNKKKQIYPTTQRSVKMLKMMILHLLVVNVGHIFRFICILRSGFINGFWIKLYAINRVGVDGGRSTLFTFYYLYFDTRF